MDKKLPEGRDSLGLRQGFVSEETKIGSSFVYNHLLSHTTDS